MNTLSLLSWEQFHQTPGIEDVIADQNINDEGLGIKQP
ncbi:hypothetical protein LYNGBM3L_73040 [Moorena producens 3L]|uniref:Uncharacterized protein n=1 Tax=Moorena producens 3L TaxID=489825 RepID=F4Y3B5_9CYAN|nr:hypothetical protein LYNGBM3L_73040 [Moorena producens 3L]